MGDGLQFFSPTRVEINYGCRTLHKFGRLGSKHLHQIVHIVTFFFTHFTVFF